MTQTDVTASSDWGRICDQIALCREEDFQGATQFGKLSHSQRLDALASLAVFVHECRGLARNASQTMHHGVIAPNSVTK